MLYSYMFLYFQHYLILCKIFGFTNNFFRLYDGIGRHARLKTLSLWGPGSSPGVGSLYIYCTYTLCIF